MGVEAVIRRSFDEARDLIQQKKDDLEKIARGEFVPPRRRDVRLETIASILSGDVAIHSHCYRADEILMLLDVAEQYGVRVKTLQHVLEGYKVAPEIAAHGAGASTFSDWWAYKMEAYDAIPYNVALMMRAGVNVTINSDSAELIRRLHLDSGKAIRYGMLTVDECLATVTLNTARQLGLEKRVGSIEVGKDADIALFDGHPLSVEAKCILTLVDGEVEFERRDVWQPLVKHLANVAPSAASRPAWNANTPWAKGYKFPAPADSKDSDAGRIAIVRATVVPVSAPAFADGTLLIEGGVITALGPGLAAPSNYRVVDARGMYVYPGIIDGGCALGLTEVGAVNATVDSSERDPIQMDLKASRAVHPASEHIRVARANGITTVLTTPGGGLFSGQSCVVNLEGWTPAQMMVADPVALHVQFPSQRADDIDKSAEDNQKEREKAYKTSTRDLKSWFERAVQYSNGHDKSIVDPRLAALVPYATGERPVVMETGSARDAVAAVRFAEENRIRIVLRASPTVIAKVAGFLAEKRVPVLLGPVTALPASAEDPYDTVYSTPGILYSAGVSFAFASFDSSNARNLPFQAGMATAYGLPVDAALRSITLGAAEILGIADRVGSLEVGKVADIIITDGNPLEVRTHVKHMFIRGREVDLSSKHTELYEKYLNRLSPEQRAKTGAPR
jgi:imidazolonepropionase-like amidohydrolase